MKGKKLKRKAKEIVKFGIVPHNRSARLKNIALLKKLYFDIHNLHCGGGLWFE